MWSSIQKAATTLLAAFVPSFGQSVLDAGKKYDYRYDSDTHSTSSSSSPSRRRSWWSTSVLREILGVDIRSVALFRVMLGLIVVGDLIDRGQYIYEHYTDYGVMPRHAVLENYWNEYYLCVHLISGSVFGQNLIFLFHALCGLSLAVGFYSRTCAAICWLMAYSMQVRNPFLLHGGDQYFRLLLFWSIFLPLGECCAVDNALWYSVAAEKKGKPPRHYITHATAVALGLETESSDNQEDEHSKESSPIPTSTTVEGSVITTINTPSKAPSSFQRRGLVLESNKNVFSSDNEYNKNTRNLILSAGGIAVVAQIVTMYVASVFHKSGPQWHEEGTSVYYALQLDYFRMPVGDFFLWLIGDPRDNPGLWWMTYFVIQWEFYGNFLNYSPVWTQPAKILFCLSFMFMHLMFSLCLRLGTFFWITTSAPLVALPSSFWDECVFTAPAALYNRHSKQEVHGGAIPVVSKRTDISSSSSSLVWTLYSRFIDFLPFARLCTPDRVMTIVYDDSHPSLSAFVRIFSSLFLVPCHRLIPLSSYVPSPVSLNQEECCDSPSRAASLVVVVSQGGREYEDAEAVVQLCNRSPIAWPLGWFLGKVLSFFPGRCQFPRWAFSQLLAPETSSKADNEDRDDPLDTRVHYRASSSISTSTPSSSAYSSRNRRIGRRRLTWRKLGKISVQVFVGSLLVLVIAWNMANFGKANISRVNWIGWLFGLDQAWGMFSPHPPLADWYHVIETTLEDNSTIDLIPNEGLFKWEGSPLTWEKPVPIYWSYMKSHRWQKVWENFNDDFEWYRLQVGRYICREYNKRHRGSQFGAPKIREFIIWAVYNQQRLDNTRGPMDKVDLWHHMC